MSGITNSQLFSNGRSSNSNGNSFDITSILEEDNEVKPAAIVTTDTPLIVDTVTEKQDDAEEQSPKKAAQKRKPKNIGQAKRVKVKYDDE